MAQASSLNYVNHGFEIRHTETKGRGMFTTRSFKAGETILEEEPLFSSQFSWNYSYGYAACDFCMRPLETAEENAKRLSGRADVVLPFPNLDGVDKESHLVCPHCAVSYCSSDCRDKAWNLYHQTLCLRKFGGGTDHPIERLNEAWKMMHYPPETASIMLLARILAALRQCSDRDEIKSKLLSFCHQTVNEEEEMAHKLLGQTFVSQLETLRQLAVTALEAPENSEFLTPNGFRSLFALIGRNGQGIGTSSFSVWVRNVTEQNKEDDGIDTLIDTVYEDMEKESGDFWNNEGSALYFLQSACNHSCEPNSIATFPHSNHMVVLVASRDLEAGEEVLISYLDECALSRSRHSRRKILKENYLFSCDCPKCLNEADQPDVTSDEESMDED